MRLGRYPAALLFTAAALLEGCGYMGPPLPPALKLPNRVADLSAVERGSSLIVHFTMSRLTTEALPIEDPPEIELRLGVSGPNFNERDWLEHSRRIPAREGQVKFEIPITGLVGQDAVLAVRLLNDRGKSAGWSNFVAVPVTPEVTRPRDFVAQASAHGVQLSWSGSNAPLFRVFRKGVEPDFTALGDTAGDNYADNSAEYGKPYTYVVQGIRKVGDRESESDLSAEVSITAKDTFAPATPVNLRTIAEPKAIELSWDRNTESDLAGYRVFRSDGDAPFARVGGDLAAPSYTDRDVKPGVRYRYEVSSFDLSGNESAPSPAVEGVLP